MNILGRVFQGRISRLDRKASATGQLPGSPSSNSPRKPCRRTSKTSRAVSRLTRPISAPPGHSSQSGPDLDEVAVKQEDYQDNSHETGFPLQGDVHNDDDINGLQDNQPGHVDEDAQQNELGNDAVSKDKLDDEAGSEDEPLEEHIDEDQLEGEGGYDDDAPWDNELEEDAADDSQRNPVENAQSQSRSLSSDDPIDSIESNDKDESEDQDYYRRPKKESPFLPGRDQSKKVCIPQCEVKDERPHEDFETELEGEREDDLIIYDADLRDWTRHKRATIGIDKWPTEACRLYKLLFLRGLYPLMPWGWAQNLNTIAAIPIDLFTPRDQEDKALITANGSAHTAERALRQVFELWIRVSSMRRSDGHDNITRLITRELKQFIRWAEKDSGFWKTLDYVSPCVIVSYKNAKAAADGETIVEKCQDVIQRYRNDYADRNIENYPRMIYIFVVIQHIVVVMAADTTEVEVEEEPYPLAELDISKQSHWLDSTLGIAIPVMLARQSLVAHRCWFPEAPSEEDEDA